MYVCMYVCMYVGMDVCTYVCMYVYLGDWVAIRVVLIFCLCLGRFVLLPLECFGAVTLQSLRIGFLGLHY